MAMEGEICAPKQRKHGALILAHNCTRSEVQELARKARMSIYKIPEVLP